MKLSVNSQNEANLHYIHEKLDQNFLYYVTINLVFHTRHPSVVTVFRFIRQR